MKRKQSFDKFLNQLFSLDGLDDEEVLMFKQLSALPSIEIGFKFLETIFQKKEDIEFEEELMELDGSIFTVFCIKLYPNNKFKAIKFDLYIK